jgi:hypothetical protein
MDFTNTAVCQPFANRLRQRLIKKAPNKLVLRFVTTKPEVQLFLWLTKRFVG